MRCLRAQQLNLRPDIQVDFNKDPDTDASIVDLEGRSMIEIRRRGAGDGQLAFSLHLPWRSLQEWKKQLDSSWCFFAVLKCLEMVAQLKNQSFICSPVCQGLHSLVSLVFCFLLLVALLVLLFLSWSSCSCSSKFLSCCCSCFSLAVFIVSFFLLFDVDVDVVVVVVVVFFALAVFIVLFIV